MKDTIEIRWHGRGGQGAKTAALLLADVAFKTGKYVQGFPEYGPERMGAPITAYNRISSDPIRVHSNIYEPQYVVVVDESLIEPVHVTAGLAEDGAIIINTPKTPDEVRPLLKGYKGRVYTLDAKEISLKTLGKNFPNSPMASALSSTSHIFFKPPLFPLACACSNLSSCVNTLMSFNTSSTIVFPPNNNTFTISANTSL